ncbi:MAG: DNA polymerase III subunit gamma/tau [Pseudomonadota bacterium]
MSETLGNRDADKAYRVLARKYRPSSFAGLIGQEALVRTVTNAIESQRLAHAFILTGVRGTGKTTSARIIARALNCIGEDGQGDPTPAPCGACDHCQAISQDRHVDVIEMDAASRTGVADIRELIDGVRYRPVQARYKVYIIDEVHMLSNNAFNALLKTLEEPPEHVIFIFATTEIRKVPITVLSRCQRFDLRRVDQKVLSDHFAHIVEQESLTAEPQALAMIARAADGSVRDGLSLLDQAIALSHGSAVTADQVAGMLGLADRTRIFDLFDNLMGGKIGEALTLLEDLYRAGADPLVVLQDLLALSHFLTRAKVSGAALEDQPEVERVRGTEMAKRLSLPILARVWQILLKGMSEAQTAPAPLQAVEMVLIRLAYSGELPTPGEVIKNLQEGGSPDAGTHQTNPAASNPTPETTASGEFSSSPPNGGSTTGGSTASLALKSRPEAAPTRQPPVLQEVPSKEPSLEMVAAPETKPFAAVELASFEAVIALARDHREAALANHLMKDVHLVHFEPGRIDFRPGDRAPGKLANQLSGFLSQATGRRWMVSLSQAEGLPPLHDQAQAAEAAKRQAAMAHPLVKAAMDIFPGARLVDRRDLSGQGAAASDPAVGIDDATDPNHEDKQ